MIGDAVQEEKARRASNRTQVNQIKPEEIQKFTKLTVIGVVLKDGITYGNHLSGAVSIAGLTCCVKIETSCFLAL